MVVEQIYTYRVIVNRSQHLKSLSYTNSFLQKIYEDLPEEVKYLKARGKGGNISNKGGK